MGRSQLYKIGASSQGTGARLKNRQLGKLYLLKGMKVNRKSMPSQRRNLFTKHKKTDTGWEWWLM